MHRITVASLLLLAGTATSLEAQGKNVRNGFWAAGGLGSGSFGADCETCDDDRRSAPSGYLALGGTLSSHVLLGVQLDAYSRSEDGVDGRAGFGSVVATIYPRSAGAFFFKVGTGGMTLTLGDGNNELKAKAPSALLGIGYDIRVGQNLSVTPYFHALGTSEVSFRYNDVAVPVGQKIRVNMAQLGISLTIH